MRSFILKTKQFQLIFMQIALEEFTIAYDKLLYEESIALRKQIALDLMQQIRSEFDFFGMDSRKTPFMSNVFCLYAQLKILSF